jgi:hypothetical protein
MLLGTSAVRASDSGAGTEILCHATHLAHGALQGGLLVEAAVRHNQHQLLQRLAAEARACTASTLITALGILPSACNSGRLYIMTLRFRGV